MGTVGFKDDFVRLTRLKMRKLGRAKRTHGFVRLGGVIIFEVNHYLNEDMSQTN